MVRSDEDLPDRDRWSRLRFAIIGGLLACPPAEGELQGALEALAARTWRHPFTGLDIRFGTSTIQRWYYAARRAADPISVLRNQVRQDIGRFPSFSAEAAQALRALYSEHPGWNAYWQACQYAFNPKYFVMRRKRSAPQHFLEERAAEPSD
jgi:putative transposase